MTRNKVFISYSHKDRKFFEEFQTILAPLVDNKIVVWDDRNIPVGSDWKKEIQNALQETCVAVMLVSPNFLASKFIATVELPALLAASKSNKLKICWVLKDHCRFDHTELVHIQAAHDTSIALSNLRKTDRIKILTEISGAIETLYGSTQKGSKAKSSFKKISSGVSAYICHTPDNKPAAQKLEKDLRARGIQVQNEQTGQITVETEQSIRRSNVVLALITQSAKSSAVFKGTVLFALEEAKKNTIALFMEKGVTTMPEVYVLPQFDLSTRWEEGLEALTQTILKDHEPKQAAAPFARSTRTSHPTPVSNGNPFVCGNAVPVELFYGRKTALKVINDHVGSPSTVQSLSIVANRRMGKSSLLRYIYEKSKTVFTTGHTYVPVYIDFMNGRTHSISGFMSAVRQELSQRYKLATWKEKQDGDFSAFETAIKRIAARQKTRLLLLLDELEAIMAYKELDILLFTLRSLASLNEMGMITATAHDLIGLEQAGDLQSRFSGIFKFHYLGNFSRVESDELVKQSFLRSGQQATEQETSFVHELAGGHPYLTQIAGSILWTARQEKKERSSIIKEFKGSARDVFSGIMQRMSAEELALTKRLLKIRTSGKVSVNTYEEMENRGLLTGDQEFFSSTFAEYARESLS